MQIPPIYESVGDELRQVEETLRNTGRGNGSPLLSELLDYVLDTPGKRLRPAVTLLSFRFHPHDPQLPILMASAVEMLHIATLVHDDTVDEASIRRGRLTVSNRWGKDVAVLLGDYVFATAVALVCDAVNVRVIRLFSETIMALSAGQLREFMSSYNWELTREQYWQRITDKTASLFSAALESGAVLSGAPERDVQALKSYGHNLGMTFQIVDDILDFEGQEEVMGKPIGSDLAQGVMTLPAILLAERYPGENSIKAAFDDRHDSEKLRAAVEMIRGSSIIQDARDIAEGFSLQARESLKDLPDIPARRSLMELTEYVVQRER